MRVRGVSIVMGSRLQVVSKPQRPDDAVDSALHAGIFGFRSRNHYSAPPKHLVGLHADHQAADIEFLRYHLGQFLISFRFRELHVVFGFDGFGVTS